MASQTVITLYDAASQPGKPQAWNTIVLRARYSLKFKGIPHKTVWLEYPDIEPTMKSIGAAPTSTKPDGNPRYTLPVIVDPSRTNPNGGPMVISDSWAIAEYLDVAYPNPGLLFPDGTKAMQMLFQSHITRTLFIKLAPILVARVVPFLNEASVPYWRQTREAYLGGKLEDLCPEGSSKWDETWTDIQKGFSEIAAALDKNDNGGTTLVMGNRATFIDFVLVSILDNIFVLVPEEWGRVKQWDGGRWEKLRDHCAAWRGVQ